MTEIGAMYDVFASHSQQAFDPGIGAAGSDRQRLSEFGRTNIRLAPRESIVWLGKPSLWFILWRFRWSYGILVVLDLVLMFINRGSSRILSAFWEMVFVFLPLLGLIVISTLIWRSRLYALTAERILSCQGVLRTLVVEIPLSALRQTIIHRTFSQRLLQLGSIGFATASGHFDLWWSCVSKPADLACLVRCTLARSNHSLPLIPTTRPTMPDPARPTPGGLKVIGLAGGIGSGKSHVARLLSTLGCLVIDSDQLAKAALDRPEVRDQLVEWWGREILVPNPRDPQSARIDRAKVASIVFDNPAARLKLESLIHPLVRSDRETMLKEAAALGKRAAVIDAPLLFEAGLDKECDAVIFIDAPRAERLERVRKSRNWDPAELERREAAQWPLETKQARSTHVLMNSADAADLPERLQKVFEQILAHPPGSTSAGRCDLPQKP